MSTSRIRSVADLVSRCSFPRWIDLEAQVEGRCSTEGLGREGYWNTINNGFKRLNSSQKGLKGLKRHTILAVVLTLKLEFFVFCPRFFVVSGSRCTQHVLRVEEFVKLDLQPFMPTWMIQWLCSDCVPFSRSSFFPGGTLLPFRFHLKLTIHLGIISWWIRDFDLTKAQCSSVRFSATWRPHHGAFPTAARALQFPDSERGMLEDWDAWNDGVMSY